MVIERPRSEDYIIADGLHIGIVNAEVFVAAQEYMKKNHARPVGEQNTVKNPLSELVGCGMCGRRMVRRHYGNGYPDTIMCPVPDCKNVSSHLHLVEERVLDGLREWLTGYKLEWQIEERPKRKGLQPIELKRRAISKVDAELETLNKQLR